MVVMSVVSVFMTMSVPVTSTSATVLYSYGTIRFVKVSAQGMPCMGAEDLTIGPGTSRNDAMPAVDVVAV